MGREAMVGLCGARVCRGWYGRSIGRRQSFGVVSSRSYGS